MRANRVLENFFPKDLINIVFCYFSETIYKHSITGVITAGYVHDWALLHNSKHYVAKLLRQYGVAHEKIRLACRAIQRATEHITEPYYINDFLEAMAHYNVETVLYNDGIDPFAGINWLHTPEENPWSARVFAIAASLDAPGTLGVMHIHGTPELLRPRPDVRLWMRLHGWGGSPKTIVHVMD